MPNSTSGGGVSRRINNSQERKKLKTTLEKLNVPSEMGLIIRTAGAKTTSTEIKRDYKYLTKTWDKIKEDTLSSNAPALIYEDGGVIQRTLRDLYTKDVDNIYVEGSEIYKITKNFMKLLMPSHAVKVKQWKESSPIFQKNNISWPQQPPTEKLLNFNMIFHDSTPKKCFSKHQNKVEFKNLDDSEVLSSDFPGP